MTADINSVAPDVIKLALQLIALGHGPSGLAASALIAFLSAGGLSKLLSAFQQFHGLPTTGTADMATLVMLNRPRCAAPDVMADSVQYRWIDGHITWSQAVNLPTVPNDVIAAAFEAGWQSWADVCGITPTQKAVADAHFANVVASAGEGASQGFDAANRILALSQLPQSLPASAQLTQIFNRQAQWTTDMVQAVAAHEIGHSLGLVHDAPGTLMYAYYTAGLKTPQAADIAQAVLRYGPPSHTTPEVPAPVASAPTTPPAGNTVSVELNVPTAGTYLLNLSMVPK